MNKLIRKMIEVNSEIQNDYSKLSHNTKIMVDNTRNEIFRCLKYAHNIDDLIQLIQKNMSECGC